MKKYLIPVLLFILFIPLIVNAKTCDTDKITIENITIENKTDNVEELQEATVSGKNINLNLSMSEVGDNIEYKFIVNNSSNEDYELDNTGLNLTSDYINYSFETDDNTNIVEANSSKTITLKVVYKNEVPEDKFENGLYNDNKTLAVQLSNKSMIEVPNTIKNPSTGDMKVIYILVLILCAGICILLLRIKKTMKFMVLIIVTAIIIPTTVYALCHSSIEIEANITIKKSYVVYPEGKTKATVTTGEIVKIKDEEFYVVKHDGDDLVLLAHYNLNVGNNKKESAVEGIQDSDVRGIVSIINNDIPKYGMVPFANTNYWVDKIGTVYKGEYCITYETGHNCAYVYDSNSNIYPYVENYKAYLENFGVTIKEARLLSLEEILELGCEDIYCETVPEWVKETSYWLGTTGGDYYMWRARTNSTVYYNSYYADTTYHGVRPVIVI